MKLKDNTEAEFGDIIRWNCWDSDDWWHVYDAEEVIEESENNDPDDCGIVKVGIATDLTRYINKYEMKKESED